MNTLVKEVNNYELPFKKLGDLIYQEGPVMSLFIDHESNMFLYRWVDCDNITNHWMLSSISSFELSQFYNKKISLRQYYEKCNQLAIAEIDNSLKIKKLYPIDLLPNEYLPKENSFYVDTLYSEFSNSLKAMYINRLVVISQQKSELYEVLGFDVTNKNNDDEQTNVLSINFTNDILPKSSDVIEIVQLFRALNNTVRKKILELVGKYPGITITDIYIKLKIEQSMASQHVAILRRSNLLTKKRKGNLMKYYINHKKLEEVQTAIDTLVDENKIIYQ